MCSTKALALVIYIGKETRIAKNITQKREKVGQLDQELNTLSKFLFLIMLIISFCLNFFCPDNESYLVGTIKYILLLSTIIPISLRVNLDFSKIVFTYNINTDNIEAVARNSQIPEELGRVQVIFSDKTGTITTNEMKFKAFNSEFFKIQEGDGRVVNILNKELEKKEPSSINAQVFLQKSQIRKGQIIKEMLMALGGCHNVTPVNEEDGQRILQASSPDEIALVEAAENYGLFLKDRNQREITLYWKHID